MRTRRNLLSLLAGATAVALSRPAMGQRATTFTVGFLSSRSRPPHLDADYYGAFPRRMRDLGYVEGRNLTVEWRFADGDYARLPPMAADLVQRKVEVIVALGPPGATAARDATATIPIVIVVSADPVAAGLVKSLARPGGNVTGVFNFGGDVGPKHLEMLRAIVPRLAKVAVLGNPANAGYEGMVRNVRAAATKAGVTMVTAQARTEPEIDAAFAAIERERAGAVIVALDPLYIQQRAQIVQRASAQRLPSAFAFRESVEIGGLLSYGQNQLEIYERVAGYVDRILKGDRPGDLPVQQPTRLELVINGRTARMLGLTIPQSLLIAADEVIG
jgi:putative ABC transport system substrate-binding protein